MKTIPYSALILALAGFIIICIGGYFIFIRPPLLPEDIYYMNLTLKKVSQNIPGLSNWLQKVFFVMGSFMFTSGILTIFISFTSFQIRTPGVFSIVLLAGVSSIGLMTIVNFIIDSDFKWILLTFTLPWIGSLILYRLHK